MNVMFKPPKSKGEELITLVSSLQNAHKPHVVDFAMQWIAYSEIKPRKEREDRLEE